MTKQQLYVSDFIKEDTEYSVARLVHLLLSSRNECASKNEMASEAISLSYQFLDEITYWAHAHKLGVIAFNEYPRFRELVEQRLECKIDENHWANEILGELLIRGQDPSFDPNANRIDKIKDEFSVSEVFKQLDIDPEKFFVSQSNQTEADLREDGDDLLAEMMKDWKVFRKYYPEDKVYELSNRTLHLAVQKFLSSHSTKNNFWRTFLREGFFRASNGFNSVELEPSGPKNRMEVNQDEKDFKRFETVMRVNFCATFHSRTKTQARDYIVRKVEVQEKTLREWQAKFNKVEDFKLCLNAASLTGEIARQYAGDWPVGKLDKRNYDKSEGYYIFDLAEDIYFHLKNNFPEDFTVENFSEDFDDFKDTEDSIV